MYITTLLGCQRPQTKRLAWAYAVNGQGIGSQIDLEVHDGPNITAEME